MKKLITILCAALSAIALTAGNYPDKADYLWVTVPDHPDWLYECSERAKVEIQFYKYGIPRDAEVEYEIANDMLEADRKGKLQLRGGRATLDIGTKKTPGFRDLRLKTVVDGTSYSHHIKLGFGVDRIEPLVKEPSDFLSFWQRNIKEAEKYPLNYTKEYVPELSSNKIDCYLVKLSVDRTHSVYGYLSYPKNAKKGSCPVVLCPPGAGIKPIRNPLRFRFYPENGCIRFEMEIHGLDPRLDEKTYSDISAAFGDAVNGYLYNGIEDKDSYYMKHVYVSLIKALDMLTSLPEWDGKNVVMQGGSQGGALSLVASGLDSRVTHCIVNYPALADMAAYRVKGRTGGYPFKETSADRLTDEVVRTLEYYDVVNFARHITAKVYMTWGYNDDTCPPTTSYAVWNTLNCPKESLIAPINEHWASETTIYRQCLWLLDNLN